MAKGKERKLSKQEQKRKEIFDEKRVQLEKEGYEREDLTMGLVSANIGALIIMLPFILVFVAAFFAFHEDTLGSTMMEFNIFLYLAAVILLIVLHEGIHGLVWGAYCRNHFKSIEFGVVWSMLTPYCTCSEPLRKNQYIIGAAMPTLILGFLPAIVAIFINSPFLLLLGLVLILGGGGDALIICKLLVYKAAGYDVIYIDHPYELGVVAFKKLKETD